jgi:hypothetical protein
MTNAGKPQSGYSGKIPTAAILAFERELAGIVHGAVSITFHIRDAKLTRYEIDRRTSFLPEDPAEGNHEPSK